MTIWFMVGLYAAVLVSLVSAHWQERKARHRWEEAYQAQHVQCIRLQGENEILKHVLKDEGFEIETLVEEHDHNTNVKVSIIKTRQNDGSVH